MEDRCTPVINVLGTVNPDIISVTQLGNLAVVRVNNVTTAHLFPPGEQVRVFAGGGNDTISVGVIAPNRSVRVDGQAGLLDRLVGPSAANLWNVTGTNFGTLNGNVTFLNTEALQGGAAQDRFLLAGLGRLTQVNGAGGVDLLDYSARTTPVQVNLSAVAIDGVAGRFATNVGGGVLGTEMVMGGAGGDKLIGDANHNVLVGQGGDDRLFGEDGRDLLIGGTGEDFLSAGDNDDILIAGWTNHDRNLAALAAIRAEWTAPVAYPARVAGLQDATGVALTLATVHDDGVSVLDDLAGGIGRDWYFLDLVDDVGRSVASNEVVTVI